MAPDPLLDGARHIARTLTGAGHQALFAGGCVRDRLLGRAVHDYDVATSARPDDIERLFRRTIPVGRAFGVMVVLLGDTPYEVATFRADGRYLDGRHPESVRFADAAADARRRDFTINGLFLDPATDEVLDFVDGRRDLEAGVVRAIGDARERFGEDKLRLLRAVRFSAQLGFRLEPGTEAAVAEMAPQILQVSWERIRDEISKLLITPRRDEGFSLLRRTGLCSQILPELDAMVGCTQPPEYHPEGDVWTHTLLALKALDRPDFITALATLLHDIAKPATRTVTDRIRFNGHDREGARMAETICRRLRMSNDEIEAVCWLVDRHLVFLNWPNLRRSTLLRLFAHPHFDRLLAVVRADTIGSQAEPRQVAEIERVRRETPPEQVRPAPLVTGHDLIAMGHAPGPRFKEILTAVQDAQLEGRLADRESALAWVRATWPNP